MNYLLDTNVISEIRKGARCNESVAAWWSAIEEDEIFFSVLTIGEIRRGIENLRRRDSRSAAVLERWLLRLIRQHGERILMVDLEIAEEWAHLNVPNPLATIDGLLAATAKVHNLTLVTRNVSDVARTGVPLFDPWHP